MKIKFLYVSVTLIIMICSCQPAHAVSVLISTGKSVTASGNYNPCVNLTDGNTNSFWNAGDYSGWAQIDLGESILV